MTGVRTAFLSGFVGRAAELVEIRGLVTERRLVTLLGTGGLGKTRLGFRTLEDLAPTYSAGAWSVELAELVDPALLAHAVAHAMGIPSSAADDLDVSRLCDHLGEGPALLYLDNCEHLLEACALLVTTLLARCPGLHVLTSSRQALGVAGEWAYPVPPLAADDAVALFADRAVAALPSWALTERNAPSVHELCAALEGVPLAVELAAVQIRAFTPRAMSERLHDKGVLLAAAVRGVVGRRSSLEACLQWSFDLCTPEEQRLLARLSVFGGGFALDAAEAVCSGDGLDAADVVAALAGLVDKSLVVREVEDDDGRYRMLEVIRQFGAARLGEAEEQDTWRRRHRDHYLALALRFEAEWVGPDQRAWMDHFRREHANLRLAFDFSVDDPAEAPVALRMSTVLEHYFASTGGGSEAVHWLRRALAHGTGTPLERAHALRIGTFIAALTGALDIAAAMYDAMVPLTEQDPDERIRAYRLYAGAFLRTFQGDPDAGAALAVEGLEILHRLGDVGREANLHFLHGMMLGWADRPGEAALAYQRCFELTEPRRERWLTSYSLWGLGVDAFMAGRLDDALKLEREALRAKADFGDLLGIGLALEAIAWVAAQRGRGREAALLLGATEEIWATIGMSVGAMPYLSRRREEGLATTRRLLSDSEFEELHGTPIPRDDAIALALGEEEATDPAARLTPREREIATMLAAGESNRAIADRLFISVRTVETHVERILRKLGVESRGKVASALVPRVR